MLHLVEWHIEKAEEHADKADARYPIESEAHTRHANIHIQIARALIEEKSIKLLEIKFGSEVWG